MITPTTKVKIYDFNGDTKPVKLITLAAWAVALKYEAEGKAVAGMAIEPIVREFLSTPEDYPLDAIAEHIETSYNSVKNQLTGKEEINLT